jgi:transposase
MARSDELTGLFQFPALRIHRDFEICRAYFLEGLSAKEIGQRFQLHVGTVQSLVRDFAQAPDLELFFTPPPSRCRETPKRDAVRARVIELREQGWSLGEIRAELESEELPLSESYLATILKEEGFPRMYRQPSPPGELARDGSEVPLVADVRAVDWEPGRVVTTQAAGLFLFIPLLLESQFSRAVARAEYPGSQPIPATSALLALLAAKLLGKRRLCHINDLKNDAGAGLFAGLNVLPKSTYATDYSYRTQRRMNERFLDAWMSRVPLGDGPLDFNLDFHAVPFRGKNPDLEQHWVAQRHTGMPAVMTFVAQEKQSRVMCYGTADLLREEADGMVVKFARHWKKRHGHYPGRLLFDSRATTYEHLDELNRLGVGFITVRRRGAHMIQRVRALAKSAWQSCQITQAHGRRRRVRYLDERVSLEGYTGEVRQVVMDGLGHESPTFMVTNDLPEVLTPRLVLKSYASRNHVEQALGEKIQFFHLDCLASDVRLKADFDLTLTMVAALLYHQLASRLKGFSHATPYNLYRKFVNIAGHLRIESREVVVYFEKRSHNPVLKAGGFEKPSSPVPWLNRRTVRFVFP